MDKKSRRSSILKKTEEDITAAISSTSKLKRRISFSGKKSVRVFRGDDETKAYDNSYEESDHAANLSLETDTLGHNIVNVHQKRIALRSRVVVAPDSTNISSASNRKQQQPKIAIISNQIDELNKENHISIAAQQMHIKSAQAQNKCISEALWNSTMDFINNTQVTATTLRVENSVEVSLNDNELCEGVVASNRVGNTSDDPRPSISFSMEEVEPDLLQHGKRPTQRNLNPLFSFSHEDEEVQIVKIKKIGVEDAAKIKTHVIAESQMLPLGKKANADSVAMDLSSSGYEDAVKMSICSRKTILDAENMAESFSTNALPNRNMEMFSIHIDESTKNKKITTNFNDIKRKTIKTSYDMEISRINDIQNRENIPENLRRKTIANDYIMDMSGIYHIQNNENIQNYIRRKTVNQLQNMEMSDIERIENKENVPLQLNARNTTKNHNDVSQLDMSFEMEDKIVDILKNATSNFNDKLNSISLRSTKDELKRSEEEFEEFFQTTILPQSKHLQHQDDQNVCEMDLSMEDIEKSPKISKETLQKTINFNDFSKKMHQDLEISPSSSEKTSLEIVSSDKHKTIIFNNKEAQELDVTKAHVMPKTDVENVDVVEEKMPSVVESDKKGAIPKVVVVRKTCVTKSQQETIADLQFQRFQRYQNKQEQNINNKLPINDHKTPSSSAEQSFMSPESQSIFPPHCQQYGSSRKLNFRKLNDDIESGKIQLFPDTETISYNKPRGSKIMLENTNNKFLNKIQHEDEMEIEQPSPVATSMQSNNKPSLGKRQTLLLPSDMEVEQPLVEHEVENKYQTANNIDSTTNNPFNFAKRLLHKNSLSRSANSHSREDSFDVKLNEARLATIYGGGNNNLNVSPLQNTEDQKEQMRRLYEGTPHRSILEFEHLEKEAKNDCYDDMADETLSYQMETKLNLPESNAGKNTFENSEIFLKIDKDTLKSSLRAEIETENPSYNRKQRKTQFLKDCELEESLKETKVFENENLNEIGARKQLKNHGVVHRKTLCEPLDMEHDNTNIEAKGAPAPKINISSENIGSDLDISDVKLDISNSFELNIAVETKKQKPHENSVFNIPRAKERRTEIFNDFDVDESFTTKNFLTNENKNKSSGYEQQRKQKTLKLTTRKTICEPSGIDPEETNVEQFEIKEITKNKEAAQQNQRENGEDNYESSKVDKNNIKKEMNPNLEQGSMETENQNQKMSIAKRQTQFYADLEESLILALRQGHDEDAKDYQDIKCKTMRRGSIYEPVDIDLDETNCNQSKISKWELNKTEENKKKQDIPFDIKTASVATESKCSKQSTLQIAPAKFSLMQAFAQKRGTINLTPNCPEAKKRQTLLFDNCDIEEQLPETEVQLPRPLINQTKSTNLNELFSKRKTLLYHETIGVENASVAQRKSIILPEAMDVENNINDTAGQKLTHYENSPINDANTAMELSMKPQVILIEDNTVNEEINFHKTQCIEDIKTPTSLKTSRIPILIESAKKNNSILSMFHSPRNLSRSQYKLTPQEPRRAVSKHIDHSSPSTFGQFIICEDKSQCMKQTFEDNPITISDVSNYYLAQNASTKDDVIFKEKEEDTQTKTKYVKKLVDMTFESGFICAEGEDSAISDERISLVGTLLDEDDDEEQQINEILHEVDNTAKDCIMVITKDRLSSMCHKCKRCQNTINEGETLNTSDSFVLPEMPPLPDLGIERLKRLRAKPTIEETLEYWRRVHLAADTHQNSSSSDEESESEDEIDLMEKEFDAKVERWEKMFQEHVRYLKKMDERKPFHDRLDMHLSKHLPNWIFNSQIVLLNYFQFDHRKIITFSLIATYEPKDPLRKDVTIKCIKLQPSRVPETRWFPMDFILDFQLKLELPFNLNQLCRNKSNVDDGIYNALEEIDKVCVCVEELGMRFWKTVCRERATLIRGQHAVYVLKTVRKQIPPNDSIKYTQIQRTEFKIEITNIRKICYKDIVAPPLHLFRSDLEHLPIGLEFLSVFLRDPDAKIPCFKVQISPFRSILETLSY